ncbi:hypothetical protein VKT23_007662 [Stygiomarasmius scandens]|uniref:F-box domain-containing protein n=1 Tax=Marasmiellus scandens TaxID=2682957 RepID=A0ABR1JKE5_9AGAR
MSSLCSISRIPNEVLIEIFLICLPYISPKYLFDTEEERLQPAFPHVALQLSQVCGRWRALAFSASRLWSQIIITSSRSEKLLPGGDEMGACSLLHWTSHYLVNSRTQPLEIVLQSPRDDQVDIYKCMAPLIDLILKESHRWRRVHLSLYGSHIEELSLPEPLPLLEFFHICATNLPHFVYGLPTFTAPRMQELILSKFSFPPDADVSYFEPLASPNLAILCLCFVSVHSTLQCLAQASPNLSVTALMAPEYDGPLTITPIVSHINALTTTSSGDLSVGCSDPLYDLFDNILYLPNVCLLDFTGDPCQGSPFPYTPFISFLSRRSPDETPIVNFSLKWWILKDDFLLQILELLPALEHLTIDENFPAVKANPFNYKRRRDRTLSGTFLRALRAPTIGSASKCLLPCLTSLTLTFEKSVDCEAIEDLIQSRQERSGPDNVNISRLDQVSILVPRELIDIEGIEALRMMDGVVVELV